MHGKEEEFSEPFRLYYPDLPPYLAIYPALSPSLGRIPP